MTESTNVGVAPAATHRFFYGYVLAGYSFVVCFLVSSFFLHSRGIFFPYWMDEFSVERTQISLVISIVLWAFAEADGSFVNLWLTPDQQAQRELEAGEFAVILVGKDGDEKLRLDRSPRSDELFGLIDSMPMRMWEMQSAGPGPDDDESG